MCPTNSGVDARSAPAAPISSDWTTNLFQCYKDPSNCFITLVCPCLTFGQNVEIIDKGRTSCFKAGKSCVTLLNMFGLFCCYSCTYRSKVRGLYGLPGGQMQDFFVHLFCTYCALCQEYRELKNRGLDPSIGWEIANQKNKQRPPSPAPAMTR